MGDGATRPGPTLALSVLGPLAVEIDGVGVPIRAGMVSRILLHLAATPGGWWSAERLIDEVWADRPQPSGRGAVQTHVSVLARSLTVGGANPIEQQRHRGYRLVVDAPGFGVSIDEQRFRSLLVEADRLAEAAQLDEAIERLDRALSLWRAPEAYAEAGRCPTLAAHAAELDARRQQAERRWAQLLVECGRAEESIPRLEAALVLRPDDQQLVGALMRAHVAANRPQDAAKHYSSLLRLLRDEYGDVPVAELRELNRRIVSGELSPSPAQPEPTAANPERCASPVAHDRRSLVGAADVVAEATRRLLDRGQLTLVGSLGVGKSRVAREACRRAAALGVPTIAFVSLAGCSDLPPDRVADRIADALGTGSTGLGGLARLLADRVGDQRAVLVLDNADDALDAVTAFVLTALGASPRLGVLVTSREPMRIPAEVVLAVPPLPTSPAGVELLDLEPSRAAQLFLARLADCGASIPAAADREALLVVERICRRLDGLPLALEVAAGLAARHELAQVDALLAEGAAAELVVRGAHAAQRTLRDAIGWSWARLTDQQRHVLAALCTFTGPADPAELAGVAQLGGPATINALIGLAERSLIAVEHVPGPPRYRALETVRAVVVQLAEPAVWATLRSRHADWAVTLAARAARAGEHAALHDRVAELRAALRWLLDHGDDARALTLADAAQPLLYRLASATELTLWLNRVAADTALPGAAGQPSSERTELHAIAVDLRYLVAMTSGELAAASGLQPALAGAGGSMRPGQRARALVVAALWAVLVGDYVDAGGFVEDARRATEDDWLLAWIDAADAFRCRRAGEPAAARALAERSLEAFADLDDVHGSILPALTLARIDAHEGRPEAALARMVAATTDAARLGDRLLTALGQLYQAQLHFDCGSAQEACRSLRSALHAGVALNRLMFASTLEHVAGLAILTGHSAEGVRLCGFTFAHRPHGPNMPPPRRRDFLASAVQSLGEEKFEWQLRQGRRLHADKAIALAERCLELVLGG